MKSTPLRRVSGFTIVELLVVIVVIGILAAISVVAFNGVQNRARTIVLVSDLKNAATQLSLEDANNGRYPETSDGLKTSDGTTYQYTYTPADNSYCLTATSEFNGVSPHYVSNLSQSPKEGACEGHSGPAEPGSIQAIDLGSSHGCSTSNGKAYCWGWNSNGGLGDGTTTDRFEPVAVDTGGVLAGKTVTAISVALGQEAGGHTCAVASGQAYCWGMNFGGPLGDGTSVFSRLSPVAVDTSGVLAGKTVTAISGGDGHTCAVASGQAYCWGYNGNGQLGDGTSTTRLSPVAVSTSGILAGKTVTAISSGTNHTCAVASGQIYCWGSNNNGQLGDSTMSDQLNPVAINPGAIAGKTVTAISSGSNHTCAVASGQAYCWGSNNNGQLGVGNSLQFGLNPMPVNASGVLENKTINSISAGVDYTCVRASGQAYCWGDNSSGQLGDATTSNRSAPVSVNTSGALAGKTVSDVSAGLGRTCAVASGQAYCWGAGYDGLIQSTPVAMSPLPQL